MLPEEDRQALKKNGYTSTAKGIVPIDSPLQTPNRKYYSSEAELHRQGERDPIKDSRRSQTKSKSVSDNKATQQRHEQRREDHNLINHSTKASAIAPSKKAVANKNVSVSDNKATQQRHEQQREDHNLINHSSPQTPPKPIRGSAADLPQARKALQQTRNAFQNLKKLGGAYDAEINDLRRKTSVAQARVDASEADKKRQDFPTQARRLKSQNRGITEEIRSDLAQRAYSAKEKYMSSLGLDSSGQPIKLTPSPSPAPQQSKQDKSWWDRGKDLLGGSVNFKKDVNIGAAKAVWDTGKGLYSLATNPVLNPNSMLFGLATNPTGTLQKSKDTIEGMRSLAKNPAVQSVANPILAVRNFTSRPQETKQAFRDLGSAFAKPYVDDWKSGHPGQSIGRGFVDIGSFFVPGGAIGKAGGGANVLNKVSKAGDVTSTLSKVDQAGTTVSRATNVADKGLEKVANITEQAGSRRRAFNRSFRTEQATIIRNDESHPLRFLLDDKGNLVRSVEAGHGKNFASGNRELLGIEDKSFNSKNKTERRRFIEIDNAPVERQTAELWESRGEIPKGTVRNAPSHPGWTKGVKIKPGAVDVVERHLGREIPRLREIAQTRGVPNWRSSKDREVYRLYTQTLRDFVQQRKQ